MFLVSRLDLLRVKTRKDNGDMFKCEAVEILHVRLANVS